MYYQVKYYNFPYCVVYPSCYPVIMLLSMDSSNVHCLLYFFRKGDYYRYLSEFKTGEERKLAADQSLSSYQVCFKVLNCS
mgnify:FL=1